jgi:hypothetical protein
MGHCLIVMNQKKKINMGHMMILLNFLGKHCKGCKKVIMNQYLDKAGNCQRKENG